MKASFNFIIVLLLLFCLTWITSTVAINKCWHNSTIILPNSADSVHCHGLTSPQSWLFSVASNETIKFIIDEYESAPCGLSCKNATVSSCDLLFVFDGPNQTEDETLIKWCKSFLIPIKILTTKHVALIKFVPRSSVNMSRSLILHYEGVGKMEELDGGEVEKVKKDSKGKGDVKHVALAVAIGTSVFLVIALIVGFCLHYYCTKDNSNFRLRKKVPEEYQCDEGESEALTETSKEQSLAKKPTDLPIKTDKDNKDFYFDAKQSACSAASTKYETNEDVIINDVVFNLPFNPTEISQTQLRFTSDPIGIGAFGVVYQAVYLPSRARTPGDEKPEKQMVAVKKMRIPNEVYKHALEAELKLLHYLGNHRYVIELIGAAITPEGEFSVVQEFCELGSLKQFLSNFNRIDQRIGASNCTPPMITVGDMLLFAEQIANGMQFIHYRKCVHRDLAARNILVTIDRIPKINDFGLRRSIDPDAFFSTQHSGEDRWKWCAIEVLEGELFEPLSDCWSFGVLMWEIFSLGRKPYSDVSRLSDEFILKLKNGARLTRPNSATPKAIHGLMMQCWRKLPYDRPSFSEIERSLLSLRTSNYR